MFFFFFYWPWKLSRHISREIQVFSFVQLSPLITSSLFRIFYSRSSTVESRGPSALACQQLRWPRLFVAFTETLERILLLSCNWSGLFFSRQHQLAILGLYHCLTCLFFILIKKKKQSPLSFFNVSFDWSNLGLSYTQVVYYFSSTPQMLLQLPIMMLQSLM